MGRAIGFDPGTMFFQIAEKSGKDIDVNIIRNAFVELEASDDVEQVLSQNKWQYIKDDDKYYIIGEDSLRVAKMFPGKVELRRPMQDGVLNKGEDKKMLVMSKMLEDAVGRVDDGDSVICFCVSSESVDNDVDNTFHKARLEGMAKRLGFKTKVIEEGHAVVLSERPIFIEKDGSESPYSGIGISFGAGKVNCVLAYKGLPVIGMSATRCLSKDFEVITQNGLKKIKDITEDDLIVDADGNFVEVLDVINNGKREILLDIKLSNLSCMSFKMTKDHRVFRKKGYKWEWVEAKELNIGDIVGEPSIQYNKDNRFSYYMGYDIYKKQGIHRSGSRNLGRALGIFLGDGCTNLNTNSKGKEYGYINISLNSNDEKKINKYIPILEEVFNRPTQIDKYLDNMINLKYHNTTISKYFKDNLYDDSGNKKINVSLNKIPDQMALGLLEGLIDSDGNNNNRNGIDFTTTSKHLMLLFHTILNRFGLKHSVMQREPRLGGINSKGEQIIGKKQVWVLRICEQAYGFLSTLFDSKCCDLNIVKPDFAEYVIKDIKETLYNDFVYDLKVNSDNHSFASLGILVHNCGDYIDKKVSEQTDTPIAQITSIKENKLDFNNIDYDDDVIFALDAYYSNMIEYVFKNFSLKFAEVKSQFDGPLNIVIAGGTSMPKGFAKKVESIIRKLNLPFEIKEVRLSKDARNAVVKGCLTQAVISQKKMKEKIIEKMLD